ncbi:uncharacterized protein LOC143181442 [Calliopsis andreniformis]|uniref:uncharacterized protein LOC143181442 n=1 Tax=Calliopsis andreniformis TaxID=337506 RepID=UPI003FCE3B78
MRQRSSSNHRKSKILIDAVKCNRPSPIIKDCSALRVTRAWFNDQNSPVTDQQSDQQMNRLFASKQNGPIMYLNARMNESSFHGRVNARPNQDPKVLPPLKVPRHPPLSADLCSEHRSRGLT